MENHQSIRIAWLVPSLKGGNYWQPVWQKFTQHFNKTIIFTGYWQGFLTGFEKTFTVQVVGKTRLVATRRKDGYGGGFIYVSPQIITHLIQFKPKVIFATGFSLWTILALLFQAWAKWRVVIVYDGSSPNVDGSDSRFRLLVRRTMTQMANAFVTNSVAGKVYLTQVLGAKEERVFAKPYQVPDVNTLLTQSADLLLSETGLQHPIFLFVGQIIPRKGLKFLLEACAILQQQGYRKYTLLIVGDGEQREELEAYSHNQGLDDVLRWMGWVNYNQLGAYFQKADVFVFPTLEDIWGVVLLEAMAFGQAILCSKWAGASELMVDGENGYLFEPQAPETLAELMRHFIDNLGLVSSMGDKSQQLIAQYTPETAAQFMTEVTHFVLDNK